MTTRNRSSLSSRPPPSERSVALRSGRSGISPSRALNQPTMPSSSNVGRGVQVGIVATAIAAGAGPDAGTAGLRLPHARARHRPRADAAEPASSATAAPDPTATPWVGDDRVRGALAVLGRRLGQLVLEPVTGARPELGERPHEGDPVDERDDRDDRLGADQVADAQPVLDPGVGVERVGQRHVHVEEDRHGQDEVGHPPAPGDRGEDDRQREDGIRVPLVDAGRDDVEGQRQDRQPDEQGEPIRPARGDREDGHDHGQQERRADDHRRDRPEHGRPGAAVLRGPGVVAHPQARRSPGCGRGRPRRPPTGCRR